jgi:hypothetical protein
VIPSTNRLGLVVQAAIKLDARSPRWANLLAFLQSCYAGLVRTYDYDDAVAALARLDDDEQHALIAWVLLVEQMRLAAAN